MPAEVLRTPCSSPQLSCINSLPDLHRSTLLQIFAMEYSFVAEQKQAQLWERIPQQWRLSSDLIPAGMHSPADSVTNIQYDKINVMDIPRTCGLLSPTELEITEKLDVKGLLCQIHSKRLTAKEVVEAFCKVCFPPITKY